jgi:FlaG/FlaF family flagellin (archaellin)
MAPPVLTVKAARAAGPGATVTLRAVVLNGAELGNLRFVQDSEAGIALYALASRLPGFSELHAGDSIQVTGQLKNYNGLMEMDPIASFTKLASNVKLRPLRIPVAQAATALSEANECRLLEITGVTRLTNQGGVEASTLAGNANYLLNGTHGTLVRISTNSTGPDGLVDHTIPNGAPFDVRGILSQYAPGGSGGYQLMPRMASDLVIGGGLPRLTEEPVPLNVNPTGFTIVFSTLNPGDTRVRYGFDAKDLKESLVDPALTTRHSITLNNLIPGTTYYVEVSSQNAAGTESTAAVPFITAGSKKRFNNKN